MSIMNGKMPELIPASLKTLPLGLMKNKKVIKIKLLNALMLHAENSAVGFYRIIQPARAIADNKLARVITLPFNPGESLASVQISELEKVIKWADVALFSRLDNPASL